MKNKLPIFPGYSRSQLAADLQDAWHYATIICPVPNAESTFLGSREYRGLAGFVRAYQDLVEKVSGMQLDELPAFAELQLIDEENITTTGELRNQVRKIFKAVLVVAEANNIDAYAGEAR